MTLENAGNSPSKLLYRHPSKSLHGQQCDVCITSATQRHCLAVMESCKNGQSTASNCQITESRHVSPRLPEVASGAQLRSSSLPDPRTLIKKSKFVASSFSFSASFKTALSSAHSLHAGASSRQGDNLSPFPERSKGVLSRPRRGSLGHLRCCSGSSGVAMRGVFDAKHCPAW